MKSREFSHCGFEEFRKDSRTEQGDVSFNIEVRWLNRNAIPNKVYNFRSKIHLFLDMTEYSFSHFGDKFV